MRTLHAYLLAATLACAGAATAAAQTVGPLTPEPDRFTLTPFVGIGAGADLEGAPVALGVAVGYGFTSRWSVEGDFYVIPDGTQRQLVAFDTSLVAFSANVLYHFPAERVTPYVAAGLGLSRADTDLERTGLVGDDTSTKFAWNWGGGAQSTLTERFGIRTDVRYFTGDDLVPDHWRVYGGIVVNGIGR
jgi:opacity protein-like surface antigen